MHRLSRVSGITVCFKQIENYSCQQITGYKSMMVSVVFFKKCSLVPIVREGKTLLFWGREDLSSTLRIVRFHVNSKFQTQLEILSFACSISILPFSFYKISSDHQWHQVKSFFYSSSIATPHTYPHTYSQKWPCDKIFYQ